MFDAKIYQKLQSNFRYCFKLESIEVDKNKLTDTDLSAFDTFETAYHQLLIELVDLQIKSAQRAIGDTTIKKLYIDGGFADNSIYVALLSTYFSEIKMRITRSPLGSALGAAMVISDEKVGKKFLKNNYALKKYK